MTKQFALLARALTFVGVLTTAIPSLAQSGDAFPSRPIELIGPSPAGGGTDILFRLLAEVSEPFLTQPVVVIIKAGATGTIAMGYVAKSKPDGYTLAGVYNGPLTMAPHLLAEVAYTVDDYVPIIQVTAAPSVFCTKPDFPAKNGKEFVELLRANPDKFTYGTDGIGGVSHITAERIFRALGIQARSVPFAGASQTLQAVMGGHVDIFVAASASILPYVATGKAKCLLTSSRDRTAVLPDTTSLAELGIPEAALVQWRGIVAPKGLPSDRRIILEKAFRQGAQTEKFRRIMSERGEDVIILSGPEFADVIRTEYQVLGDLIKKLGLAKN
jgi:tripartite-type tricarboxylate transporter receptor subunit TctC